MCIYIFIYSLYTSQAVSSSAQARSCSSTYMAKSAEQRLMVFWTNKCQPKFMKVGALRFSGPDRYEAASLQQYDFARKPWPAQHQGLEHALLHSSLGFQSSCATDILLILKKEKSKHQAVRSIKHLLLKQFFNEWRPNAAATHSLQFQIASPPHCLQLRDLRQKPGSSPVQGHSLRPPHDPDPNATAKSSATGNWYNTSHSQQNGWDSRTALPHPSHNDLDTYTILHLLQVAKTTETQTLQRISQRGMGTKMVKMVKQIDNPMSLEKNILELQEFCRWPFVGAHGFWRT